MNLIIDSLTYITNRTRGEHILLLNYYYIKEGCCFLPHTFSPRIY